MDLVGATLPELFAMLAGLEDEERRLARNRPGEPDVGLLAREDAVTAEMHRRYRTYRTRAPEVAALSGRGRS